MTPPSASFAVLYLEVADFYAEIERRRSHGLNDRPILVGGDPGKKGKVQSASFEARGTGVSVGMRMREALAICPSAVHVPTDIHHYREAHGQLEVCLQRCFHGLETAGLGAVYAEHRDPLRPASEKAGEVVEAVRTDLGVPIRVGIGPSKWVASLAVNEVGRSGFAEVLPDQVAAFLHHQPVAHLPRVGTKAVQRLREMGAGTIGELLELDPDVLERELGARAEPMMILAQGHDPRPVRVADQPQTLSRGESLSALSSADPEIRSCLSRLAQAVASLLVRRGLKARRLSLRVRFEDQALATRSLTLPETSDQPEILEEAALDLLTRIGSDRAALRSVALTVGGLSAPVRPDPQLDLFS